MTDLTCLFCTLRQFSQTRQSRESHGSYSKGKGGDVGGEEGGGGEGVYWGGGISGSYTKPQDTIHNPEHYAQPQNIIQSVRTLFKASEGLCKDMKHYTRTQAIEQEGQQMVASTV